MGTLSITNVTSSPVNIQDLYITVQPNDTVDVERRWDELTAMFHLHEAIADGNVTIDFQPSEDELASGLVPTSGTAESEEINYAFYVSPTGNDSNSGRSPTQPLKTFHAAMNKLPVEWGGQCRIFFAPGTYAVDGDGDFYHVYRIGHRTGDGLERLGIIGSFSNVLGDRTSDGSTTGTVVEDTSLSMTTDEHIGKRLLMLSGAAAGQAATVVGNTATAFTLNVDLGQSSGDTFRLETPDVVFNVTSIISLSGSGKAYSQIAVFGTQWNITTGAIDLADIDAVFEGVSITMPASGSSTNRFRLVGDAHVYSGGYVDYLPGVMNAYYNGLYLKDGSPAHAFTLGSDTLAGGYLVQSGTGGQYVGGTASYYNLHLIGGGIYVGGPKASLRHVKTAGGTGRIVNSPADGVFAEQFASLERFEGLEISNAVGNAIVLTNQAGGDIRTISGTGNGGHGVVVKKMSTATVYNMTVTGTSGDMLVDATTVDHATAAAGTTGTGSRVESLT